jgi:mafF
MVRSSANKTSVLGKGGKRMAFFNAAVGVLQTLVVALGAGLGIWGAINLLEGYGNDNPGANAHVR